jgi:hypothetical protein
MNKLKPLITQHHVRINEKFTPPYRIPNRANFLIFSNHADALLIDPGDRRYLIYESPASPREPTYYKKLFSWFDENPGVILHHLSTRNIDAFNPTAHAPMTDTKREVIEASRSPVEAYLSAALAAREWPFISDLAVANHLTEALQRMMRVTLGQVATALRNLGALKLGQKRMPDKTKPVVWAVRRQELWSQADEGTIAAEYHRPVWTAEGDKATIKADRGF